MVYTKNFEATSDWGAINCEEGFGTLKMVPISSNNLSQFKNWTVYLMSKNGSDMKLKFLEYTGLNSQQFSKISRLNSELFFEVIFRLR